MESKQKWVEGAQGKELVNGMVIGSGSLKDLAEAHRNVVMEWAKDAQRNEAGRGSPKWMKWAKEAQNSMRTSPAEVLGNVN